LKKYKVVKCPKCYRFQITYARDRFKCKFCGYSTELKKLNIFYQTDEAIKATRFIQMAKEMNIK